MVRIKKEAEQKRDEYLNQLKLGLNVDFDKASLGDLMHSWLYDFKRVSENIKPSTFSRYEGIYRKYIQPYPIASLRLTDVKTVVIQRFYNDLFDMGVHQLLSVPLTAYLETFFLLL